MLEYINKFWWILIGFNCFQMPFDTWIQEALWVGAWPLSQQTALGLPVGVAAQLPDLGENMGKLKILLDAEQPPCALPTTNCISECSREGNIGLWLSRRSIGDIYPQICQSSQSPINLFSKLFPKFSRRASFGTMGTVDCFQFLI